LSGGTKFPDPLNRNAGLGGISQTVHATVAHEYQQFPKQEPERPRRQAKRATISDNVGSIDFPTIDKNCCATFFEIFRIKVPFITKPKSNLFRTIPNNTSPYPFIAIAYPKQIFTRQELLSQEQK
jgi:hypothetical protein